MRSYQTAIHLKVVQFSSLLSFNSVQFIQHQMELLLRVNQLLYNMKDNVILDK